MSNKKDDKINFIEYLKSKYSLWVTIDNLILVGWICLLIVGVFLVKERYDSYYTFLFVIVYTIITAIICLTYFDYKLWKIQQKEN